MKNNRYADGFRRLSSKMKSVAKDFNMSYSNLMLDAAMCFIRYGVTPNEYIAWEFYKHSSANRKSFFTARDAAKWYPKFNDKSVAHFFDNKVETNRLFQNFIHRDWLFTGDATDEEITRFINNHDKIIVKPINQAQGHGVHVYRDESIEDLRSGCVLLEDFIIQHHSISFLNKSSVNTIRVYTLSTFRKPSTNLKLREDIFTLFLSCSIRVGGPSSEVDNYHSGGIGYPINIESGTICGFGTNINGETFLFHPTSNIKTIGFQIPNWQGLKNYVSELNKLIPEARMIAWDIAVLEDGFELIEANFGGDPGFMQAPLKNGLKNTIIENF